MLDMLSVDVIFYFHIFIETIRTMRKLAYIQTLLLVVLFTACETMVREHGNGNMVTNSVDVDDFEEIDVSGNFEIILKKGDEPAVELTADENLVEFIDINTVGDRLIVETTRSLESDEGLELLITYTELSAVDVGGAATITSRGNIEGDYLSINMSGAGTLDVGVDLKVLKLTVSGAGAVVLKGSVDQQNINMSGAGGLDASDLFSKECKISISGVGSADLMVTESLHAEVSGVGGITYAGDPKNVQTDVSGLGSIDRAEGDDRDK